MSFAAEGYLAQATQFSIKQGISIIENPWNLICQCSAIHTNTHTHTCVRACVCVCVNYNFTCGEIAN